MLLDYFSLNAVAAGQWEISVDQKFQLFRGLLNFLTKVWNDDEFQDLYSNYESDMRLLKDISRLAGRLCRISWQESKEYQESIEYMQEMLYSDTDFNKSSVLMIYFNELMSEMQQGAGK